LICQSSRKQCGNELWNRALERIDGLTLEKLKNYRPSEKEPFMNDRQREYFRDKLLAWKDEILREARITLQTLQEENVNHPDLADRASSATVPSSCALATGSAS
jgi:hypothetical protein